MVSFFLTFDVIPLYGESEVCFPSASECPLPSPRSLFGCRLSLLFLTLPVDEYLGQHVLCSAALRSFDWPLFPFFALAPFPPNSFVYFLLPCRDSSLVLRARPTKGTHHLLYEHASLFYIPRHVLSIPVRPVWFVSAQLLPLWRCAPSFST